MKHIIIVLLFIFSARAQDIYNHCPMEGSAKQNDVKDLNKLKNRYNLPESSDIDKKITAKKMYAKGDDRTRFSINRAASIEGIVYAVKPGGVETCNCKAKDKKFRDTHIELLPIGVDEGSGRPIIVEVTPRIRELMRKKNIDWSTDALKNYIGKKVKITGWMFYDTEHINSADNTNQDGIKNWRKTCWEIHPITSIDIME